MKKYSIFVEEAATGNTWIQWETDFKLLAYLAYAVFAAGGYPYYSVGVQRNDI